MHPEGHLKGFAGVLQADACAGYNALYDPKRAPSPVIDALCWSQMNDIDPQAWLADVLARIADLPQSRLHELLPWNWKAARESQKSP